jgi:CDP-glycerol glycerophosphotransferase (TagB/SpsB family)
LKTKRYLFFISQDYSFAVLRPLQEAICARGDEVKWFLYGDEISYEKLHKEESRLFSVDAIIDYNPHAVFVPGNVVPSFIPGLKVEVFHGLPSCKAKKSGELYHYIIRGMFDLYCTQGPESTAKFQALAYQYQYFLVKETGWCKLDPLFKEEHLVRKKEKKTIFFASTFSPRFSKAKVLYPLLLNMMKKYDFNWYITLHPKMNQEVVDMYHAIDLPNVEFVDSTELTKAFLESDIMLCDTSSIIYEFLTQLKPVVTFETEKEHAPLINVKELDKLEGVICRLLDNPLMYLSEIEAYVKHLHPYRDANASQRVLDAVDEMLEGKIKAKKKKPLNLVRNFKLRKELGYWKFRI